jgi:hypothetical protein
VPPIKAITPPIARRVSEGSNLTSTIPVGVFAGATCGCRMAYSGFGPEPSTLAVVELECRDHEMGGASAHTSERPSTACGVPRVAPHCCSSPRVRTALPLLSGRPQPAIPGFLCGVPRAPSFRFLIELPVLFCHGLRVPPPGPSNVLVNSCRGMSALLRPPEGFWPTRSQPCFLELLPVR